MRPLNGLVEVINIGSYPTSFGWMFAAEHVAHPLKFCGSGDPSFLLYCLQMSDWEAPLTATMLLQLFFVGVGFALLCIFILTWLLRRTNGMRAVVISGALLLGSALGFALAPRIAAW